MATNFTSDSELHISYTPPVVLDNTAMWCTINISGLAPPETTNASMIVIHINRTDDLDPLKPYNGTLTCSNNAGEGEAVSFSFYLPTAGDCDVPVAWGEGVSLGFPLSLLTI